MKNKLEVRVIVGSWKAYNDCNSRALGSKWLNLSDYETIEEIYQELKKEGFTSLELEETFIQDIEIVNNINDVMLYSNADYTSINELFSSFKDVVNEGNKKRVCENCTFSMNKYGAVEIHFECKPSDKVLQTLKNNGFRWFKPSSSWSAFMTIEKAQELLKGACFGCADVKEKEESKELVLKSFEEITDYQAKFDILSKYYIGGLASWNKTEKDREYRDKHIIGETTILKSKDGLIIDINMCKPSIDSTLWYDDETKAPENNYTNFELYNLKNLNIYYEEAKMIFKNDRINSSYTVAENSRLYDFEKDYIRDLTAEEKQDLQAIAKDVKEAYKKRLASYWKRYQNKICWSGYWANR